MDRRRLPHTCVSGWGAASAPRYLYGSLTHTLAHTQRRTEITCSGPRELLLRPDGSLLRSRQEALAVVRQALDVRRAPLYEQCYVVRPGQRRLGGLRISLADEEEDQVDVLLEAAVRVRWLHARVLLVVY